MTQICPDCKEECPDTANYCMICQAKLPHAAPWLTDHKKARQFFENPTEKFPEFLRVCFAEPQFKDRLLTRILDHATNENAPEQVCFRDEIFRIVVEELLEEYKRKNRGSKR